MSSKVLPVRANRSRQLIPKEDVGYLLVSILLQLILGLFFGHAYDIKIFMATGYLVATGQNPYILPDLRAVFHNPAFYGLTSIGYPPPWSLILGLLYLISYAPTQGFLLYNLAIKLPIIVANICLAYLVKHILLEQKVSAGMARKAWIFLVLNPFLFYFTTAWGQSDSLVALITLAALVLLTKQRLIGSSILLALAISLKPTPVPVVLAVIVYLWGSPWNRIARYLITITVSTLILCVLPFFILHWSASPILNGWNTQFTVSGGMALTTLYELTAGTYALPGNWWLLGVLWLPAILIGALFLKRGEHGLIDLLKNSLILILIFFLTRTWLSEQNLALILPMVLILVYLGELPGLALSAVWILPLIFTVFNDSPPQLLFPILPDLMTRLLQWTDTFRATRLFARMLAVLPWQLAGWWMVMCNLRSRSAKPV